MKNMKLIIGLVGVLIIAVVLCAMSSYAGAVNKDIAEKVIRLHVIANSDSMEDQNLKYAVRDSVLEFMRDNMDKVKNDSNMPKVDDSLLSGIENVATREIKSEGYSYGVKVTYGVSPFPTKTYGDVAFPAGYYNAVKVEIGKSVGQNWWCVMFPPLCMINATSGNLTDDSKAMLKQKMSDEDYEIITSQDSGSEQVKVKFKIVELMQTLKMDLAKIFG